MMNLPSRIDAFALTLPDDDGGKARIRAKTAALSQECACAFTGCCVLIAAVLAVAYFAATGWPSLATGAGALGLILLSGFAGKAAGLVIVQLRLFLLYREVVQRVSQKEVNHVDMHEMGYPVRH